MTFGKKIYTMGLLALPFVGLLLAASVLGGVRAVRFAARAEALGPPVRVFLGVLLLAVTLGVCLPLAFLAGQAIYGWSLLFYLFLRWLVGVILFTTVFEIAHRWTKNESLRMASSAVLVAGGVLVVVWFTAMRPLLSIFGITMTT